MIRVKCPSCGKEVSENKSYCDKCGSTLFGPRSIDLKDLGGGKNTIQSNNIKSITGIDINDITPVQNTGAYSNNKLNDKKEKIKIKKEKQPKKMGTIVMMIIIAGLLGICVYLFLENRKLGSLIVEPPENTTPPVQTECIEGIYGITDLYNFYLPDNWVYSKKANEVLISNQEITLIVYQLVKGKVDHITSDTLKNEYINQGYTGVTTHEQVLNSRKIMFVTFSANDMYFVDYYYQFDAEKIIYGQITSRNSNILTEEVKDILSSLTIPSDSISITMGRAPVNYEKIFSLMM